jgi:hypothetical protein
MREPLVCCIGGLGMLMLFELEKAKASKASEAWKNS